MSEEDIPRRVRLARASLQVDWDSARVRALAAGLEKRRHRRRGRRLIAAGATVGLAAIAALALVGRRSHLSPGPDRFTTGPAGLEAAGPPAVARRPRLAPAESAPAGRAEASPSPSPSPTPDDRASDLAPAAPALGPLRDLARDPAVGESLLAEYARAPETHPTIANVSYAGYHLGDRLPSSRPATTVNVKASPFHAAGDGVTDDTEAIRQALRSVERTGGVVFFPDGEYLLSNALFVHGSNTRLEGQSRDGTRLVFTRSLDAALGPNDDDHGQSRWQWAGGLVWFAPRSHYTYPKAGERLRWRGDGWTGGAIVTSLSAPRARGERTLEVAKTAGLRPGALVLVAVDASDELSAAGWRREPRVRREGQGPSDGVRWPVEIAAIDGNLVTLKQPLRFDLPLALHPRLQSVEEGMIRDCGLERMTLVMKRDPRWAKLGIAPSFGWNGPFFQDTLHGFAREVTVVDADEIFGTAASKSITFSDVKAVLTTEERQEVRGFAVRAASHDVLIERLEAEPGYVLRARLEGSGIALSRMRARLRSLYGRATDTVLTDLTLLERPTGKASPEALRGERVIGWRIRFDDAEQPPDDGPAAPNLYEAQHRLRLEKPERAGPPRR
jgi:hypothetical protein